MNIYTLTKYYARSDENRKSLPGWSMRLKRAKERSVPVIFMMFN